jgi:hypothetical protein
MDKIKDVYLQYHDKVMAWYDGMTYVEQFFTLFGLFVLAAVITALYFIKRASS